MSNPVSQSDLLTALDNLILAENNLILVDTDVTVARLMDRANWTEYRAKKIIDIWVKEGKLEYLGKRRELARGAMVKAWKIKDAPAALSR